MAQGAEALSIDELAGLPSSDILFITTPDDAIAETARRLALQFPAHETARSSKQPGTRRRRVVLHASGALSSEPLAPLRDAGFSVGSMHPLVSVSDAMTGKWTLRGAFYCLEGDADALRVARSIVRALEAKSFSVSADKKALYHAAAVMTAGHTVALFATAVQLLVRCGLSQKRAREVLLPLLQSTLNNLSASPPDHALTGTFARADVATVSRHLEALASVDENTRDAYRSLGLRSIELARKGNANDSALKEIERLLRNTE
jgi:predicted short-subunit dehydrogenase-like oxidoreductase (DUF2520 family)